LYLPVTCLVFCICLCGCEGSALEDVNSVDTPVAELRIPADVGRVSTSGDMLVAPGHDSLLYVWSWDNLASEPRTVGLELWVPEVHRGDSLPDGRLLLPLNRYCTLVCGNRLIQGSYLNDTTSVLVRDTQSAAELKRWALGERWDCDGIRCSSNGKFAVVLLEENYKVVSSDKYEAPGRRRAGSREDSGRYRLGVTDCQLERIRWVSTIYTYDWLPSVETVHISGDGKFLAAVGTNNAGYIHVVDVEREKLLWEKVPHGEEVPHGPWTVNFNDVCFSPDSKYIYVAGNVGLFCFDVATGKILSQWQIDGRLVSVAASPDGKLVAGGEEASGFAYIYEAKTGKLILMLVTGQYSIFGLAFSPDSKLLATSGVLNTNIKIWKMPAVETQGTEEAEQR